MDTPGKQKIIRRHVVTERVGFSDSTLNRLVKTGSFPKPFPIARGAVGWLESDIDAWIAERAAARTVAGSAA